MDIFVSIMFFIMGTVFGSFFTLAVYRIPLKKDITHERSFCPNCNHRLEFLDLIPVLSYIFLKGKCRYCGQKIRIRYLLLEVLSGLVFLFAYLSLNISFPIYSLEKIIEIVPFVFMYITIAISIGIYNDKKEIHLGVLSFGFITEILYIVYLYIFNSAFNIYRYGIYILISIFLYILQIFIKQKKYICKNLLFLAYLALCSNEIVFLAVISYIILYVVKLLVKKILNKDVKFINFVSVLGTVTILLTILKNFYIFR